MLDRRVRRGVSEGGVSVQEIPQRLLSLGAICRVRCNLEDLFDRRRPIETKVKEQFCCVPDNKSQRSSRARDTKELTLVGVSTPLGVRLGPLQNREAKLAKDVRRFVKLGGAVPNGLGLGHDAVRARQLFDLGFSLAREPARLPESVALRSGERIFDRNEIPQQLHVRPIAGAQ